MNAKLILKLLVLSLAYSYAISIPGNLLAGTIKVEDKNSLRIVTTPWPTYAYAFIADEKGYFAKNKVSVEFKMVGLQADNDKLYKQGEADGIMEVLSEAIIYDSIFVDSRVIYAMEVSMTADFIVGNVDSISDLKGKTIGIFKMNSFSHLFVLKALENAGLKPGEVNIAIINPKDAISAIKDGKISAAHTWGVETREQAQVAGYKILAEAKDVPGIIISCMIFSDKAVREKRQAVQAFLNAFVEAQEYFTSHKDECIEIMSRRSGLTKKEIVEGLANLKELHLKENIEMMNGTGSSTSLRGAAKYISNQYINLGQIDKIPDLDKLIDPGFLNAVNIGKPGK